MSVTAAPSVWGHWHHLCNSAWPVTLQNQAAVWGPGRGVGGVGEGLDSGSLKLTFQTLLPQRHHLIELTLNQPICLLLIQPIATGESLLDAGEGAQYHHLEGQSACGSCLRSAGGAHSAASPAPRAQVSVCARTSKEPYLSSYVLIKS